MKRVYVAFLTAALLTSNMGATILTYGSQWYTAIKFVCLSRIEIAQKTIGNSDKTLIEYIGKTVASSKDELVQMGFSFNRENQFVEFEPVVVQQDHRQWIWAAVFFPAIKEYEVQTNMVQCSTVTQDMLFLENSDIAKIDPSNQILTQRLHDSLNQ